MVQSYSIKRKLLFFIFEFFPLQSIFKTEVTWKNWMSWWPTKLLRLSSTTSRCTSLVLRVLAKRPLDSGLFDQLLTCLYCLKIKGNIAVHCLPSVNKYIGLCRQIWNKTWIQSNFKSGGRNTVHLLLPYVLWTYILKIALSVIKLLIRLRNTPPSLQKKQLT